MSMRNVELHRRVAAAFNDRDVDAFIALSDPTIELHSLFASVGGAIYHGHDGLRQWHRDFEDTWADVAVEVEAYFDLGDDVLAFYDLRGRGRQSGVEVRMPNALLATWRDEVMVFFKVWADREQALRDLGLTEGALEPIPP